MKTISILGTVGVPASYGGFETLVENLVRFHYAKHLPGRLVIYCSARIYPTRPKTYLGAELRYIGLNANGISSIAYDVVLLFSAVRQRSEVILLLGVSGAIALPLVRLFSSARITTNIDGLEWRREKWGRLARWFLRFSEKIAVRFSDEVIADNAAISKYVRATYGIDSHLIPYGGDHAVTVQPLTIDKYGLPESYAFSVCRIEPENNVHIIIEAFTRTDSLTLVMVGNWSNSDYGRNLRLRYSSSEKIRLLDPIYELQNLATLRSRAKLYVHGHSAGGTNPSLVEAMHFGRPIVAFDCNYNRATTEGQALYFKTADDLISLLGQASSAAFKDAGLKMQEIALRRYRWDIVADQYFRLLEGKPSTVADEELEDEIRT